ncbi:hypothetical protein [Gemelliphila palaticanis]|uniref:Uncharacterized protein n=1 Tax=Gemelliphila palaticanis TaxID=81950 RepID=A0ABX2SXD7_9BACL|nr:hypothetical protein [Gemella palaticanis]MBF0714663.1 hypothetical protein [Gemella palaticanis]NYS46593.1 hypothetical protein [Gemella palaticanis]
MKDIAKRTQQDTILDYLVMAVFLSIIYFGLELFIYTMQSIKDILI